VILGRFGHRGTILRLEARRPSADVVSVQLSFDEGSRLDYVADRALGRLMFDGGRTRLTAAQHQAIERLDVELGAALADSDELLERGLSRVVSFYAMALETMPYPRFDKRIPGLDDEHLSLRSTGNDGKTCRKPGTQITAEYEGDGGHELERLTMGEYRDPDFRGANECLGLCGSNCSGKNPWTQDCAEHDLCSFRYKSTTGVADHNCGGEWTEAADDLANPFSTACEYGRFSNQGDVTRYTGRDQYRPAYAIGRWRPDSPLAHWDDYLASHGDLIAAYGYNLQGAKDHWLTFGSHERRCFDCFDEASYYHRYADLRAAFGWNPEALTQHYITYGYREGRRP
jgi:hypothetical protein